MSTYDNWMAIRNQCKTALGFAHAPLKITIENGVASGLVVTGATGTLKQQLLVCASEIRTVLMAEYSATFPYPRVTIAVNPPDLPASVPPTTQDPAPPPEFFPKLPPTTPPTSNDKIYVA